MDILYHDSLGDTIDKYGNDFFGVDTSDSHGAYIHLNFLDSIINSLVGYIKELSEDDKNKEQSSAAKSSGTAATKNSSGDKKKITLLELEVWSLLSKLGSSKLLKDINNGQCQRALEDAVASMGDEDSFEACLRSIYCADERVLKIKLLQEWLEVSARYRNNSSINVIDFNSSETIASYEQSLMRNVNNISNRADKEVLVKLIWQYLRCGLYLEAQRLSSLYETYCLGTSLGFLMPMSAPSAGSVADRLDSSMSYLDNDDSFVSEAPSDDYQRSTEVLRVSAIRQPVKMHSCFKYINRLSSSSASFSTDSGAADSVSVEYEKVIIALLSSNVGFLLSSPFLPEWSDKLYVVVKALHETALIKAMHRHKLQKLLSSRLYPDCKDEVLRAEDRLLAAVGLSADLADIRGVLESEQLLPDRSSGDFVGAEAFFIGLQVCIIEGFSSIQFFVDTQVADFYASSHKLYEQQCSAEDFASIARTLCHFLLWCRYAQYDIDNVLVNSDAEARGDPSMTRHVCPDDLLYAALQLHIGLLIGEQKYNILPVYAVYLDKRRRVAVYVQLFEAFLLQGSNISSNSYSNFVQHNALLDLSTALVHSNRYFLVDFSDVMTELVSNQIERKKRQIGASADARSTNSLDFIDLDDLRLVQLLRLFFANERYLEGIKVANSLMALFLLDSRSGSTLLTSGHSSYNNIASVDLVLATIPPDAVLCGNNVINNCIVKSSSGLETSAESQLIVDVWNASLRVLDFFESYRRVHGLYIDWEHHINTVVSSYESSLYTMSPADYAAISEKASHIIAALLSLLNPIFLQFDGSEEVSDVFAALATLTYQQMNCMIEKLLLVERVEHGTGGSESNLSLFDSLVTAQASAELACPAFARANRLGLRSLVDGGALTAGERSKLDNGITTATLRTLGSDLRDCSNYNVLLKNVIFDVLSKHNYICFQTAAILLRSTGSSSIKSSAMYWYTRVVNVATFVSKEGGSDGRSVYRSLDAAMIDALLRDVLAANIRLLTLQAEL